MLVSKAKAVMLVLKANLVMLVLEVKLVRLVLKAKVVTRRCMHRGVKSFYGNLSKLGVIDVATTGAIVCTIEKANILVNKLLEEGTLHDILSTVIVDELHMVPVSATPGQCQSRALPIGRIILETVSLVMRGMAVHALVTPIAAAAW